MKKFLLIFAIASLSLSAPIDAKCARSCKASFKKSYTKKAPYAGYGKTSKNTGKIKVKTTSGYYKPSKGYKYVNSYARS